MIYEYKLEEDGSVPFAASWDGGHFYNYDGNTYIAYAPHAHRHESRWPKFWKEHTKTSLIQRQKFGKSMSPDNYHLSALTADLHEFDDKDDRPLTDAEITTQVETWCKKRGIT